MASDSMPQRDFDDLRLVAELYYERGLTLQEIGHLTSQSVATVSRMNSQARKLGIVQISVVKSDADHTELSRWLSAELKVDVVVTPGMHSDPLTSARMTGAAAAPYLIDFLPQSGLVGWASGATLDAAVTSMRNFNRPSLSAVPLIGGWDAQQTHLDANALVQKFAEVSGAQPFTLHAPASLDSVAARNAIMESSTVQKTVKLWDSIDTAIIGTGAPPLVPSNYFTVMDRTDETTRAGLAKLGIVGDVLAHLFDINGEFHAHEWTERVITMTLSQLKDVPHVIAVAGGQTKVQSLIGLARTGYVHTIITDATTGSRVRELLTK